MGGAPAWGPPAATREYEAYISTMDAPSEREQLLRAAVHGAVAHAAVGWNVSFPAAPPDPFYARGQLTDGLTGQQHPYDHKWVGFAPGQDASVVLELPPGAPWPLQTVAAHFLAVPPLWFVDGDRSKPVARNITTWLPSEVRWAVAQSEAGPWADLGQPQGTAWWEREVYDVRTEIYAQNVSVTSSGMARPRYLRCSAKSAPPPWWAEWVHTRKCLTVGRLMLDEVIVN